MSLSLIGALVGLAFAAVEYVVFGALISNADRRGTSGSGPRVLDFVRKAQLVVFPVIGWFAGPALVNALGGR